MMARDGSNRRRKQEPKLVAEIQPWVRSLQVELSISGMGKVLSEKVLRRTKCGGMVSNIDHRNFNSLQLFLWK